MAKRRRKKEIPLTRKQISRREKERRQRIIMIAIAAFVGFLILAVLGFGSYMERVVKPASPVAMVNGVPIRTDTYQKRILLERMTLDSTIDELDLQRSRLDPNADQFLISYIEQQLTQLAASRTRLGNEDYLNDLIQEQLISQAAEEQGVTVSAEDVDRNIEEQYGYFRETPTPMPSPTPLPITATIEMSPTATSVPMTKARFDDLYGQFLSDVRNKTGMSEAEFEEVVRLSLLRDKMEELVGQDVATSELQIHARHILVETREEAEAVLERLNQGEDFAALAQELSQDSATAEVGGDLGWFPRGKMIPEFDEVAFSLAPGEVSGVVESTYGFHIIKVDERDENRELDAADLQAKRSQAFQDWLTDLEANATIERYWSTDKVPPE
jgi:parvulin-like peptidyl-prolyl isomerase